MTTTTNPQQAQAEMVAYGARVGYSADEYGEAELLKIARFLIQQGHSPREAEAIMRSKHMRWADDSQGRGAGRRTGSAAFKRYYGMALARTENWLREGAMLADATPFDLVDWDKYEAELRKWPNPEAVAQLAEPTLNESAEQADEVWTLTKHEADMIRTAFTIAYEDYDENDGIAYTNAEVEALWKRLHAARGE